MRSISGLIAVVAVALALGGCTYYEPLSHTDYVGGETPPASPAAEARSSLSTPAATATAIGSAASPPASRGATLRATPDYAAKRTGTGCARTKAIPPGTALTARIGDVDGDGHADIEWADLDWHGFRFGVETASHATVSTVLHFASGAGRSVSIGRLATGRVIALASDGHSIALLVLHNCRWVQTTATSAKRDPVLSTAYGPARDATGAGCIHGQLYAFFQYPASSSRVTVKTAAVSIATSGETATVGPARTLTVLPNSFPKMQRYEGNTCAPSALLAPHAHR